MSKPRYSWWGYIKSVIRKYPTHCRNNNLSDIAKNEKMAVNAVIESAKRMYDGYDRLDLISMIYWKKTHNLHEAAECMCLPYEQAKRYHDKFLQKVYNELKNCIKNQKSVV